MARIFGPLAVLIVVSGCSSSSPNSGAVGGAMRADELREIGGLVGLHTSKGRKAPPTAAELTGYEPAFPLAVKAIRSGEFVAVWGASLAGEGDVASGKGGKRIVAYEKKAESAGGLVILENGEVKEMTADEFKATPKAK